MTTLSAIQRGALGLATTDSPTFNGLSIDTTAGVDGQWNTSGLTVYANGVTPQHDGPLHVMSGSAGAITARTDADDVVIEDATSPGMSFLVGDSGVARIRMTNPTDTNAGGGLIAWDDSAAQFSMQTATAGAVLRFSTGAQQASGEWNTTGLTCFTSGTTPQHDGPLHVMAGSAGSITANPAAKTLVVEGDTVAGVGISILSADQGYLVFGHPTASSFGAWLGYTGVSAGTSTLSLGTNYGASSVLNFYTGAATQTGQWNTTGLTVFASGVTPQHDGVLHVMSGSAGAVTASTDSDELTVEASGAGGISILTPSANYGIISFGSPTSNQQAKVYWNDSGSLMQVGTLKAGASLTFVTGSNSTALTLNSSQQMVALTTYSTTVGATNRDLYIDNTGLIGYVSSLQAAKTDIQQITDTSWLHNLNPVSFKYRKKDEAGHYTDEIDGDIQYGMVAEEVETVRPDLCFYDDVADLDENGEKTETTHKELRGIQYSKLVPVLLKEVQKLRAELNQMKAN